jgi:hypothetical protein
LGSPFYAWAEQPVFHHPGVQERPDKFQQPLVIDTLGDTSHQSVVIDSIEGSYDTLPIISTFPSGLRLSAVTIHLKDVHSRFLAKSIVTAACTSS